MSGIDLTFVPISGPGVEALENRKEVGSPVEISEAELKQSVLRSQSEIFAGLKLLLKAPPSTGS